jgi:hypothetical protein
MTYASPLTVEELITPLRLGGRYASVPVSRTIVRTHMLHARAHIRYLGQR